MPRYQPKLIKQYQEAEGTLSYVFERPDGFEYLPGQHVVIQVDAGTGKAQDGLRTFTLASSPTENDLLITLRESGSLFKKTLKRLQPGDSVNFFGPAGRFVFPETSRPIVMIAGGVGVVPFRVFIKHAIDKKVDDRLVLLHSNPNEKRISYKNELDKLQADNVLVVNTLTESIPDDWGGEHGRINKDMIDKYSANLKRPLYYICGPEQMVDDIECVLEQGMGVGKEDIHSEKFTGY